MARQWGATGSCTGLPETEEPTDETVRWGSQFSIHSAPIISSDGDLGVPSVSDNVSEVLPSSWEAHEETQMRPCSLTLPANGGLNGFTLAAMANEAHLRHCPILVKDLSCETADDEENENHLTISSLTARPLIAKSHELRTRKVTLFSDNLIK